ncbi:MAG: hypothetical protein M1831_005793 [Alyxoria varia]|nr:MAG: hypothetical protein M1831_005793 [Alyxoria varia]
MSGRFSFSSVIPTESDRASQSRAPLSDREAHSGRPSLKALGSSTNLSSSLTQRGPARSFVHQAAVDHQDPAEYASHGVREHTAELASLFLTNSLPPSSGLHRSRSVTDFTSPYGQPFFESDRLSGGPARPDVIVESPGATSPGEDTEASPPQRHASALASMFKDERPAASLNRSDESSDTQRPEAMGSSPSTGSVGSVRRAATERTPLIAKQNIWDENQKHPSGRSNDLEQQPLRPEKKTQWQQMRSEVGRRISKVVRISAHPKEWKPKTVWRKVVVLPFGLLPCVFLGLLLNVLDALSYGMILFPLGESIFAGTGADGISMFYVSCIVSQLVYSCGGSIFKGAVGSEMIEVVPFFHQMAYTVMSYTGKKNPKVVLATVITSYAMSSVLTGIVFFILGAFKLGSLVSFFPRHILIGCIGGVGFFLFVTGIEVSARLEGNLEYNLETAKHLVRGDTAPLWTVPLGLSIILLIIKRFNESPYVTPAFFVSIAAVFYILVAAIPALTISGLRETGWVFHAVEAGVPFYNFYSYYDFNAVDWEALSATIPAMFALTFFGLLHVPINIPALGIAVQEDDLNLNRELVAHGISNAVSGFCGSIQNYLVYVNSQMFISNGGNSRLAGIMLAVATFGVLIAGPDMIGFVPIMVVGALIFYLGTSLLEEALWDTWGKMNKLEYFTVLAIVLIMGIYDFVAGVFAGIVLACLNFVVQTSRKNAIRASYSGEMVQSMVRRHAVQRRFLHEVGHQIYITKLAGMLFFGSIVQVEKKSRALIEEEAFKRQPIRYLIFDFDHVTGLDYSAAEAFQRMQRILARRQVCMIISGVEREDDAGTALRSVGLWQDESSVRFFETLNMALEYCENELLTTFYQRRDAMAKREGSFHAALEIPQSETLNTPSPATATASTEPPPTTTSTMKPPIFSTSMSSPRQRFLHQAANATLDTPSALAPKKWSTFKQPLPLILQIFQDHTPHNEDFWFRAVPYFRRIEVSAGTTLFRRGDPPSATAASTQTDGDANLNTGEGDIDATTNPDIPNTFPREREHEHQHSHQPTSPNPSGFYLIHSGLLRATYTLPVGQLSESIVAGTTCGELPFFSGTERTATVTAETEVVAWVLEAGEWERMGAEWPEGARELLRVALRLTKERVDTVTGYVLGAAG